MKLIYRSFLNRAYPTMKKHNPHTPILIREAAGTLPRVYARYGMKSAQQRFNEDTNNSGTGFGREKQEVLLGKQSRITCNWKTLLTRLDRSFGSADRGETHRFGQGVIIATIPLSYIHPSTFMHSVLFPEFRHCIYR